MNSINHGLPLPRGRFLRRGSFAGMDRPTSPAARAWIERLGLEPHPEGGYFRETYRSELAIDGAALGGAFGGPRSASTAIYFLLPAGEVSCFHRIKSDEVWHHHDGSAVTLWILDPPAGPPASESAPGGPALQVKLSSDPPSPGEPPSIGLPQAVVPAGVWFGATVDDPDGYALVSCTVAPGFDFRDFELARRDDLLARWPHEGAIIERLTVG